MPKKKSNIGLEAFLFLVFASAVWLAMQISSTTVSKQINVELIANGRVSNNLWLEDSTQELNVIVSASGLDAIFMDRFNNRQIIFDSKDFLRDNGTACYLLASDIEGILKEEYGRDYQFSWVGDTLIFISEPLVTSLLPVKLLNEAEISLPEGYRWINTITIQPDSIALSGPKELIEGYVPTITLPTITWQGDMEREFSLDPIHRHISSSVNWVKLSAKSDAWVELNGHTSLRFQNNDYHIELWLSGPMGLLSEEMESLVEVEWRKEANRLRLDIEPLHEAINVLDYKPKYIEL